MGKNLTTLNVPSPYNIVMYKMFLLTLGNGHIDYEEFRSSQTLVLADDDKDDPDSDDSDDSENDEDESDSDESQEGMFRSTYSN